MEVDLSGVKFEYGCKPELAMLYVIVTNLKHYLDLVIFLSNLLVISFSVGVLGFSNYRLLFQRFETSVGNNCKIFWKRMTQLIFIINPNQFFLK